MLNAQQAELRAFNANIAEMLAEMILAHAAAAKNIRSVVCNTNNLLYELTAQLSGRFENS